VISCSLQMMAALFISSVHETVRNAS